MRGDVSQKLCRQARCVGSSALVFQRPHLLVDFRREEVVLAVHLDQEGGRLFRQPDDVLGRVLDASPGQRCQIHGRTGGVGQRIACDQAGRHEGLQRLVSVREGPTVTADFIGNIDQLPGRHAGSTPRRDQCSLVGAHFQPTLRRCDRENGDTGGGADGSQADPAHRNPGNPSFVTQLHNLPPGHSPLATCRIGQKLRQVPLHGGRLKVQTAHLKRLAPYAVHGVALLGKPRHRFVVLLTADAALIDRILELHFVLRDALQLGACAIVASHHALERLLLAPATSLKLLVGLVQLQQGVVVFLRGDQATRHGRVQASFGVGQIVERSSACS